YHRYRALALPLLLVAIALLGAVLLPGVGTSVNGAARWLRAGPVGLQPAEFAKLALILYLAAWLGARRARIAAAGVMLGMLVITTVLPALAFTERDLVPARVFGSLG